MLESHVRSDVGRPVRTEVAPKRSRYGPSPRRMLRGSSVVGIVSYEPISRPLAR